jgi:hypothetical protein
MGTANGYGEWVRRMGTANGYAERPVAVSDQYQLTDCECDHAAHGVPYEPAM